jgi:hypothetical protein
MPQCATSLGLIVADNQVSASVGSENLGISISLDLRNGPKIEIIVTTMIKLLAVQNDALIKMRIATRHEVDDFGPTRALQAIGPN